MKPTKRLFPIWKAALHLANTLIRTPDTLNRVRSLIRNRDVPSLCVLGEIRDQEYQDHDFNELLALRQVASLFKKNEGFSESERCRNAAMASFLTAEKRCRIANRRLEYYYMRQDRLDPALRKYLSRLESSIEQLLGDVGTLLAELPNRVRLTSGATQDRSRRRAHPFLKITGKVKAPLAAETLVRATLSSFGIEESSYRYEPTDENRIGFVPKNWKTFRTIGAEPTHVLPLQLAVDDYIKDLLRSKWRVDLSTQQRNQELARIGSIDGSFATVDLSQASDSLALNTLAWLLPPGWFDLVRRLRCDRWSAPDGSTGQYAKFASMGNGLTFVLETLIFAACCRAVGSRRHAVYGDDIAIETELVPELQRLLGFLGFAVNSEKTFHSHDSRFRESCGADWYKGRLVTPLYLRELCDMNHKANLCQTVNTLVAASGPGPLWTWLAQLVQQENLRIVPYNEDVRSGVWIHPHDAWVAKKIFVDTRRKIKNRENPLFGFPVFHGYIGRHQRRKTAGWRSLLLWFFQPDRSVETLHRPQRHGDLMLHMRHGSDDDVGTATVTSSIITSVRYHHGIVRFNPVLGSHPIHLALWGEEVGISTH